MSIVFDSFALLALFRKEKGYEDVVKYLSSIDESNHGYLSVINLGEVYYITCRKQSKEKAELALTAALQLQLDIVSADIQLTLQTAQLKSRYKLSYADAFAAALTIEKKAMLITGDPEFKALQKEKNFKVHFINQ